MAKPLTNEDILKLETLFTSVFSYLDTLRAVTPLALTIQYPKIPSVLSESLIIRLHSMLFKGSIDAEFGKPESDVRLSYPGGEFKHVEVKATGESAFEFFGKRDLAADYLIWIHFGRYFHGKKDSIAIYCLPSPSEYFQSETKITLKDFLKRVNGSKLTKMEGQSISALLGRTLE